ncbi:hypothetical protein Tco_0358819 [Tanacetum coccineum]
MAKVQISKELTNHSIAPLPRGLFRLSLMTLTSIPKYVARMKGNLHPPTPIYDTEASSFSGLDKVMCILSQLNKRSYKTARAPQIPTKVEEDSESLVSYQWNNGKTCAPMVVSEREVRRRLPKNQQSHTRVHMAMLLKRKKVKESIKANIGKLLKYSAGRQGGSQFEVLTPRKYVEYQLCFSVTPKV